MPSRPSIWKHSNIIFERMKEDAEDIPGIGKVWKGFLTQLILAEQSLPSPYYTYITSALKQTNAIRQLKRGGGKTPSEWLVMEMPDKTLFDWKLDSSRIESKGTRNTTKARIVEQAIDGLQGTVLELTRRVEILERHNNGKDSDHPI